MAPKWIPLESNPEVLNQWAYKLGLVASQDQFSDIWGLDPEVLSMAPQPVKAVILLFPITDALEARRKDEDAKLSSGTLPPVDPTVIWIKQTISNACGTIGLLHALINSRTTIAPESPLATFIEICKDKTPEERAELLEKTALFADVHAEAASGGQSAVPDNLDTNLHFTCFVEAPSAADRAAHTKVGGKKRLIELDGRRAGPIDRGPCEDLLKDVAAFVEKVYIGQSTELSFNMMALAPPPPS